MPYKSLASLPDPVRDSLPAHAQKIYRKAFNSAWEEYKDPNDRRGGSSESREEVAHKVAWAAVKKQYSKDQGGNWAKKRED